MKPGSIVLFILWDFVAFAIGVPTLLIGILNYGDDEETLTITGAFLVTAGLLTHYWVSFVRKNNTPPNQVGNSGSDITKGIAIPLAGIMIFALFGKVKAESSRNAYRIHDLDDRVGGVERQVNDLESYSHYH